MGKKPQRTTEQHIVDAQKVHGNAYDYPMTECKGCITLIKIGCLIHGIIEINPVSHTRGCGCNLCGNNTIGDKLRKTKEQLDRIQEAIGNPEKPSWRQE